MVSKFFLISLVEKLTHFNIDNPWRELRLLISFIQKRTYAEVFFDCHIHKKNYLYLSDLVDQRCKGKPLSKIVGYKEFWSLKFKVTVDTLDPRPDSETLIQSVMNHFPDQGQDLSILDLGTGTGCLLLSLLSEYPNSWGVGIDMSYSALRVANENALDLGLSHKVFFACGNWGDCLNNQFDIIISNPPYIGFEEKIDGSVKHYDPPQALYAGKDGLSAYEDLFPSLRYLMKDSGLSFIEIGIDQKQKVKNLAERKKLMFLKSDCDFSGIERVLIFKKI